MTDPVAAAVSAAVRNVGNADWCGLIQPFDVSRFFSLNFKDIWWTSAPENLRPLRGKVELFAIYDIIGSEGLPLVPCPRPDVVLELMEAADTRARRTVLEQRAPEVVEDCDDVFVALQDSPHAGRYVAFARDAVVAFRSGAHSSAQAMVSALTTTILDEMKKSFDAAWRAARYRDKGDDFPEILDEAPPYEYWILAPLWHAYEKAEAGDLVDKWGRHSSIHKVSDVHYNVANSVVSLMFLAALLDFIALVSFADV